MYDTACAKNDIVPNGHILQYDYVGTCPDIISHFDPSDVEICFGYGKRIFGVLMVMVEDFHPLSQNTILANLYFSQARDCGSGNVCIVAYYHFRIGFYGNEVGLIDCYVLPDLEIGIRRDVQKIISADTERIMNLAFRSEKKAPLLSNDTIIGEVFQLYKKKPQKSFHLKNVLSPKVLNILYNFAIYYQ